MNTVLLLVEAK